MKRFFGFKQRKKTRRKGIKVSQFAIKNFNDITGKHINTPCVFYLYLVFLKFQNISNIFLQKKNTSSSLQKRSLFPVLLINIRKTDKWFITCYKARLWRIRILIKDKLKNKLVYKNPAFLFGPEFRSPSNHH